MDDCLTCNDWKARGNELFIKEDFVQAEIAYTAAIDNFETNKVILYTNRAAARLALKKYEGSLEDSNMAIELDPQWVKAYYRKSVALENLRRLRESFEVWPEALLKCEHTPWLLKHVSAATSAWVKVFRTVPVVTSDDFIARYKLLTDSRQR